MLTAVRVPYNFEERRSLIAGTPQAMTSSSVGPIAWLAPRCVAAYKIEGSPKTHMIVFRTAPARGVHLSQVAGISPAVEVLVLANGHSRALSVERALRLLNRWGVSLDEVPSSFWARLAVVASRRKSFRQNVTWA
jgi:hypothetical protein